MIHFNHHNHRNDLIFLAGAPFHRSSESALHSPTGLPGARQNKNRFKIFWQKNIQKGQLSNKRDGNVSMKTISPPGAWSAYGARLGDCHKISTSQTVNIFICCHSLLLSPNYVCVCCVVGLDVGVSVVFVEVGVIFFLRSGVGVGASVSVGLGLGASVCV